jgi:hypothetical protein
VGVLLWRNSRTKVPISGASVPVNSLASLIPFVWPDWARSTIAIITMNAQPPTTLRRSR